MVTSRTLSPIAHVRTTTPAHLSPNKRDMLLPAIHESPKSHSRTGPRPPPSPHRPSAENKVSSNGHGLAIHPGQVWTPQRTLGTVEEVSSSDGSPYASYRPRVVGMKPNGATASSKSVVLLARPHADFSDGQASQISISQIPPANKDGNLLPTHRPKDPIMVESMQHKRMSTG